jgi:hypothetical protein
MGPHGGQIVTGQAYSAACRRFPRFELAIRRMMLDSETFCDICLELAEAETALANVDKMPAGLRESRRAEWEELVGRLVREIELALYDRK